MFIPNALVDGWIEEDVPGLDLTSHLLGMKKIQGQIVYTARGETTLCGTDEAVAIFERIGLDVEFSQAEGTVVNKGDLILKASGNAASIHTGWRVSLNVLEYASGIATRTAKMVQQAQQHGGAIVCGTRKAFPGGRKLSQKALVAGGGVPHRMGLGETVLIFANHYNLLGLDNFLVQLPVIKEKARERKIGVEVDSLDQAVLMAKHGADIIQLDKCSLEETTEVVRLMRQDFPQVVVGAAGGVNGDNAGAYAATGVDFLATSWMYFGKPADISAVISV
jgi:molybdenum transport protein